MQNFTKNRQMFIEYLQIEKNASPYTIKYYQNDLKLFYEFLQVENIVYNHDIDQRVVRIFLTTLYDRQLSRRSVSRTISCLKSFYKFLERENKVQHNPFVSITLPRADKPIPGFLYEEELQELFTANDLSTSLGQRDQAIIEVLYATGIRVSECQSLTLEDVNFSIGSMFVRGKGRKERYVLFGQFADDAMKMYINDGRKKLLQGKNMTTNGLFLNSQGKPLTTRGFRFVLQKMVERAALTVHVHPHKLRHTFATHMLNEGADLRTVQELLGHDNLSSTQIYTHVTKDYLQNVYMDSHPRAKNKDT